MSDKANMVYLVLILIMLISGLVSRRDLPIAKAAKYLFYWAVIVFIAIGIYSYRFEFSGLKNRILSELNPTAARLDEHGRLVINISQDGHFYVDTKINGQAVRFMIDTGASDIVLGIDDAVRIGINSKNLVFNKRYQTANGEVYGASIRLNEIEVGGVKFHDMPASINSADLGVPLLGMAFLRQFTRYEFYQDKLILEL